MWNRRGDDRSLEAALRSRRAEAPADFVLDLSDKLLAASASPRRAWSRIAFASAVSVLILGSFASFGGVSYAASGASGTYNAVKQVVVVHKLKVTVHRSSAQGVYSKPKPSAFTPPKTHTSPTVQPAVKVQGQQTLPFTGLSLLGTFLVSLALIGTGLVLRRRERRS
jgi:hypothetical protein